VREKDGAIARNQEGAGKDGLVRSIPTQAILRAYDIVRIKDDVNVRGQWLIADHLRGVIGEVLAAGAGVDEDDLCADCGKLRCGLLIVLELLLGKGALVARISAQQNEDYLALAGKRVERQGTAIGGCECEVGGTLTDARGCGDRRKRDSEQKGGEEDQSAHAHSGDCRSGGIRE